MQDLYSLPYLDSIKLALGQSSDNIINMSITQYFINNANNARTAMCHKFHYIILYGNNISKLLSMHIIHDCETKFNLKVKKIKH